MRDLPRTLSTFPKKFLADYGRSAVELASYYTTYGCMLLTLWLFAGETAYMMAGEKHVKKLPGEVVYEMRVYHPNPGKFELMLQRFQDDACRLIEKHNMQNVAYFVTTDPEKPKLIYFLAHQSREAREASWKAFLDDPEWKEVYRRTEANGPLVSKIDSLMLKATDYSPEYEIRDSGRSSLFELRTYKSSAGNLAALDQRFREHTVKLFEQHGMQNIIYFHMLPEQAGSEDTLIYLLVHADEARRDLSFNSFRQDPKWQAARAASEVTAGGPLTVQGGVQFELLKAAPFSPLK